jgi:hypothetical protein
MGNINEGASETKAISTTTNAACVNNTLRREIGNENVNSPAAPGAPDIHGQEAATIVAPIVTA